MKFDRSAGILLHPTSLPGRYGIGDLGDQAYRFIDFLKASDIGLWQVLPLGPTGYGDSPYQCFSAFAGNPLMVSPDKLVTQGLLTAEDVRQVPAFNPLQIDFGWVIGYKTDLLRKAYQTFSTTEVLKDKNYRKEYTKFCKANAAWLDDYALFMAVKNHHGGVHWKEWAADIRHRVPKAVKDYTKKLAGEIEYQKFIQFNFFYQWNDVKAYANGQGIKVVGDLPIFIAYDSADCWANRHYFTVDEDGHLETCAGVPPDYFSPTGQLWGNPLYRWDAMEADDFQWWRDRFAKLFEIVDIVRIDHFRGFEAFWEIKGNAKTAEKGKWVKAPGKKLFSSVQKHMGNLPIIAEDLGVITPEVEALRDKFEFPGMKIMQFAFGTDMETKFLPHNFIPNCVVYTGSHDNDTTRAYFDVAKREAGKNDIYEFTQKYLNYYGEDLVGELIRVGYASVADTVVFPMQDLLNLGTEARMNFPGKLGGNWSWRFSWEQVPYGIADRYKALGKLYDRPRKVKK
ncbi:MAG: 4-alpha-glucanotransferase [Bacteroidetes bacterium]|nr:4-alpha-glucanotransferase [Bacteroidota bacterium]